MPKRYITSEQLFLLGFLHQLCPPSEIYMACTLLTSPNILKIRLQFGPPYFKLSYLIETFKNFNSIFLCQKGNVTSKKLFFLARHTFVNHLLLTSSPMIVDSSFRQVLTWFFSRSNELNHSVFDKVSYCANMENGVWGIIS